MMSKAVTKHEGSSFAGSLRRSLAQVLLLGSVFGAAGCGSSQKARASLSEERERASASSDGTEVATWLLDEMLAPSGTPQHQKLARKKLDELSAHGMLPEFGRALDDLHHGRPMEAGREFFSAVAFARDSEDPRAPLVAWFGAHQTYRIATQNRDLAQQLESEVSDLLARPGRIGFRAYASLVDIWMLSANQKAETELDDKVAERLGCVGPVRLSGPFGEGHESDLLSSYPAEGSLPWPARFEKSPHQKEAPRILRVSQSGCDVDADEAVGEGVYYAETFLELSEPQELILTAAGAFRVWVDDKEALRRDPRTWGIWPKFGMQVALDAGRHRVLWKLNAASTGLRILLPDGRPAKVLASVDPGPGYLSGGARLRPDPNVLMRFISPHGVRGNEEPITSFVAATLANLEGQPDVATVLLEPLVKKLDAATGLSLMTAAAFVEGDPIYDPSQTQDLMHELLVRAAERDPELWSARLDNALFEARQKGTVEAVRPLEELVQKFPKVPALHYTLAQVYEELSWGPELDRVVERLVKEYPDSSEAIGLGISFYEARGDRQRVDELLARLLAIDPDTEVLLTRALVRKDYQRAISELERLGRRRPEREDIAERIIDVMVRAGNDHDAWQRLERAVEREPKDIHARMALADHHYQRGDRAALAKALVMAISAGSEASPIEEALDLVNGTTALEPFRLDAKAVIAEYESRGSHQEGTAARVLDYGAILIRSDGSSRFLEHEVVRIQSEEGIRQFAEMSADGLVLHLRVLKKDGRILEPEAVSGKPTVTMPHLEIGDYVETERVLSSYTSDSLSSYRGPNWFFREENIAYARSEFVVVSPADLEPSIESVHGVPEPKLERHGAFVARRFRMDNTPAAPSEPNSPPSSEFLPRVSIGFDLNFDRKIQALSKEFVSLTPVDPRILRIGQGIVRGIPAERPLERARKLYHWVLDHVQEGEESDGRRVIVSQSGNRARGFEVLCQALGIDLKWAVAESRISSPILGAVSSFDRPLFPLLVLTHKKERVFLTIDDKFSPFATVPSHLRGSVAYLLGAKNPEKVLVPEDGALDGVRYEGSGSLKEDGSATLALKIHFLGSYAASFRNGLSQIPEAQLGPVIEGRLLSQYLQGAQLVRHEVIGQGDLDQALVLAVLVEVPGFATRVAEGLLLPPPFMPRLSGLTTLATRSTPLLIGEASEQSVELSLELPRGMVAEVSPTRSEAFGSSFTVKDTVQTGRLTVSRTVKTAAGRINPDAYPEFQAYTKRADGALGRAIRVFRGG